MKNGLIELLDCIPFYSWTYKATEDARKTETSALPAENTICAKRITDSPLQSELEKKRKNEDASQGDFIKKPGKRKRTRPSTRLIKPTEGKTFAEVLSEIDTSTNRILLPSGSGTAPDFGLLPKPKGMVFFWIRWLGIAFFNILPLGFRRRLDVLETPFWPQRNES